MSNKSLLSFYLSKVASGDNSMVEKLLHHLSDRLVYVPLLQAHNTDADGAVKLNIACLRDGETLLTPVFTSEREALAWCKASGNSSAASESLLGADLCAALGQKMWIVVNPDTPHSVRLTPEQVSQMAEMQIETLEDDGIESPVPSSIEIYPEAVPAGQQIIGDTEPSSPMIEEIVVPSSSSSLASGAVFADSPKPAAIQPVEPKKRRSFLDYLKLS